MLIAPKIQTIEQIHANPELVKGNIYKILLPYVNPFVFIHGHIVQCTIMFLNGTFDPQNKMFTCCETGITFEIPDHYIYIDITDKCELIYKP